MTRLALTIHPDSTIRQIDLDQDESTSLQILQSEVEGFVTTLELEPYSPPASGLTCWSNDEGLFTHADQPNPIATVLLAFFGIDSALVGPVVLTGGADDNGDTLPLEKAWIDAVETIASVTSRTSG